MNRRVFLAALTGLIFSFAAMAENITNAQYLFLEKTIEMEFWSAEAACCPDSGNARDVCVAIARGNVRIAKAELNVAYNPTAKTRFDERITRADAYYLVAIEKCDDVSAENKLRCINEASVARSNETAQATVQLMASGQPVAEVLLADEKCTFLVPDAKVSCLKDAANNPAVER